VSRWYIWRDRQMDKYGEANRRFPLLMRTRLKVTVFKSNATFNVYNEEAYQSSNAFGLVLLT